MNPTPQTLFSWIDRNGLAMVIAVLAIAGVIYLGRWLLSRYMAQTDWIQTTLMDHSTKNSLALLQNAQAIEKISKTLDDTNRVIEKCKRG